MTSSTAPTNAQAWSIDSPVGSPVEARHAPRRTAIEVPAITGLRIFPRGTEAVLVNISTSGLLAECGEVLRPGSQVTVVFEGDFSPSNVEGHVARCAIASVGPNGTLRYHIGIAFSKSIALPDASASAGAKVTPPNEALVQPTSQTSHHSAAHTNTESPVIRNRW
jgi:hypothetical protein